jgi:hypothetical protein
MRVRARAAVAVLILAAALFWYDYSASSTFGTPARFFPYHVGLKPTTSNLSEGCMVIRHIGVWSVARLYGALSGSIGLLFGAIVALVAMAGGMAGVLDSSESGLASGGLGMMFGVGAVVFLPLCYGVMGVVVGAIGAALYNLFAGMFGGIELDTAP